MLQVRMALPLRQKSSETESRRLGSGDPGRRKVRPGFGAPALKVRSEFVSMTRQSSWWGGFLLLLAFGCFVLALRTPNFDDNLSEQINSAKALLSREHNSPNGISAEVKEHVESLERLQQWTRRDRVFTIVLFVAQGIGFAYLGMRQLRRPAT
jgi:hypothetical protein